MFEQENEDIGITSDPELFIRLTEDKPLIGKRTAYEQKAFESVEYADHIGTFIGWGVRNGMIPFPLYDGQLVGLTPACGQYEPELVRNLFDQMVAHLETAQKDST